MWNWRGLITVCGRAASSVGRAVEPVERNTQTRGALHSYLWNHWMDFYYLSSMELSRPVVVQHHGHLTLTMDFQGQILKMLYLRNGRADWHGTKGMWIDGMLHPLCDFQRSPQPWPWPWIFKVKFWKSHISGMGWPIDMELKGCESIECWTHSVTFNVHLTHDLYLGFSRSNFEKVLSQEWDGRLTRNERDVSR